MTRLRRRGRTSQEVAMQHHTWGRGSLVLRASLHSDLVRFVDEFLRRSPSDLRILDGHRDKAHQDDAFARGASKARWGQSPHNRSPSWAVDVAWLTPGGSVDWNDMDKWRAHGALGEQVAADLGLRIKWGGRFSFFDGPHFELDGWRNVAVPG